MAGCDTMIWFPDDYPFAPVGRTAPAIVINPGWRCACPGAMDFWAVSP